MLFGYPLAATSENWLHESVVEAVLAVHRLVDEGRNLPVWPKVIPAARRAELAGRTGLKSRISNYAKALRGLSIAERERVCEAVVAQNRVAELLSLECECSELNDLPEPVRECAKSLFTYVFGLLSDFGIRQRQYKVVCAGIPARVCPFCGSENLDAPGLPQEDLDHYIPRSKYPFAAANLLNLAPMGHRCNSLYKMSQDPLKRRDGVRRIAFNPFSVNEVKVSFESSAIDEMGVGPVVSDWVIDFNPHDDRVETWDDIFQIRRRWRENFLTDQVFKKWLSEFSQYCARKPGVASAEDAIAEVRNYHEYLSICGYDGGAFLKAALFRMLLRKCEEGSPRLLPIMMGLAGAGPN